MKPEHKRPVSVEDLLRLKRAERPAVEFWADFDRQLRAKQLSALVGKRPWWQDLSVSRVLAGLRRYQLPLGATAIVAITFVSIRVNQTEAPLTVKPVARETLAQVQVSPVASAPGKIEAGVVEAGPEKIDRVAASVPAPAPGPAPTFGFAVDEASTGGFSRFIPLLGVPSDEPSDLNATSASRSVESAWVATAAAEPMISRAMLGASSRFEARTLPARSAVEPLQQITPPSERRGSRILTAMVSMASVESAMRMTERAASRLSEEQLYDQIHRFGARGAGVNLKF